MERLRGLARLWNWLPEFRAAGETEHLSQAAEELRVSPSAVSRTIRLLEAELGQPLFERVGRRIELNGAGERFLSGIRIAMRTVDEALAEIQAAQFIGPVKIASVEPITTLYLAPALRRLRSEHPGLVPTVSTRDYEGVAAALLRGEVDVALVRDGIGHRQLSVTKLASLKTGVYVSKRHPLASTRRCTPNMLRSHAFVALPTDRQGATRDGWPVSVERDVELVVEDVGIAAAICEQGQHVAVLPQAFASRFDKLRRLPLNVTSDTTLYAIRRAALEIRGRADAVVDAVCDVREPARRE